MNENSSQDLMIGSKTFGEPEFRFGLETGETMLRLTKEGFHYQGRIIYDHGEAYRLFLAWMEKAQR